MLSQIDFSRDGGGNKSFPTLFHVVWPRSTKKIQLISLIFANFDAENALRGKRVKFSKKTRKVNFLILDPLCEEREK